MSTPRRLGETSYILDLVAQTLNAIDRFDTATVALDARSDLSDVNDCLKRLNELFSDTDEGTQSEIISAILSCNLQNFYKFAEKVYNGGSTNPSE